MPVIPTGYDHNHRNVSSSSLTHSGYSSRRIIVYSRPVPVWTLVHWLTLVLPLSRVVVSDAMFPKQRFSLSRFGVEICLDMTNSIRSYYGHFTLSNLITHKTQGNHGPTYNENLDKIPKSRVTDTKNQPLYKTQQPNHLFMHHHPQNLQITTHMPHPLHQHKLNHAN